VLLQGEWPRIDALLLYFVLAMGFAWLGGLFFHKTRKGFADVL
jgi:ABC-type polysaccharide/polyol phosphate export permease